MLINHKNKNFFISNFIILIFLPFFIFFKFRLLINYDLIGISLILLFLGLFLILLNLIFFNKLSNNFKNVYEKILVALVFFVLWNFFSFNSNGKLIGLDPDVYNYEPHYSSFIYFLLLFFLFFNRNTLSKLLYVALIFVTFNFLINIQNFNLFPKVNLKATEMTKFGYKYVLDKDNNASSFSKDFNIIHIVLDGMQSNIFNDYLKSNPDTFEGFHFFRNTSSSNDVTFLSFPDIMGHSNSYTIKEKPLDFLENANSIASQDNFYTNGNPPYLMDKLISNDFYVDIFSDFNTTKHKFNYRSRYDTDFKSSFNLDDNLVKILSLILINYSPHEIKNKFYNNGKIFLSQTSRARTSYDFINYFATKIHLNSDKKTYKLLHLIAPHGPFTLDDQCNVSNKKKDIDFYRYAQSVCAIKTLNLFFDKLKVANIYDNSLIIVNGDHGINYPENDLLDGPYKQNINAAAPLLLVKKPQDKFDVRISNIESTLRDIPHTILKISNINNIDIPNSNFLFSNDFPKKRTREFRVFQPNRVEGFFNNKFDNEIIFTINGEISDKDSWSIKNDN